MVSGNGNKLREGKESAKYEFEQKIFISWVNLLRLQIKEVNRIAIAPS